MGSPKLTLIPTDKVVPHPDNPRVVLRDDVVGAIVANLGDEYPQKHAVHVRPLDDKFQLLAGHQRTEATRQKGLTEIWAWVEDMDDATAFMELVTSNNQGELSPLEIGIHALKAVPKAEGGRGKKGGLSQYAERVGKSRQYITQLHQAAEVAAGKPASQLAGLMTRTQHLCAIHDLPAECWSAACEWLAENTDATVKDVAKHVEEAKEYAHQNVVPNRGDDYLPLHRCMSAVFAGTDPKHFYNLHSLAVKVAEDLAEHDDLLQQWREWLESNVGGDSWDRAKVHAKRGELDDIRLERESSDEGDDDFDVKHGDFRDVAKTLEDGSVDLIFADPPYHREYLPLYAELGAVAARVLKPGGSLICYLGQYQIHEVCDRLAPHLRLWWTLCCLHTGQSARMTEYGIVVKWKPMLWFVKGTRGDKHTWVEDLVTSEQQKDSHEWQQSLKEAGYYIDKLTAPGDLVFDPFCGGGTTAVAAKLAGRRWLTCDTDPASVANARKRIADA